MEHFVITAHESIKRKKETPSSSRKSPKSSPRSSPGSSPRSISSKEGKPDPVQIPKEKEAPPQQDSSTQVKEFLSALQRTIKSQEEMEKPPCLRDLKDKKRFISSYRQYREKGGQESIRAFIDESLLQTLTFTVFSGSIDDDRLLEYLDETNISTKEDIDQALKQVAMDTSLESHQDKVLSLFSSLQRALNSVGLTENPRQSDGRCFSESGQIQWLISRLPDSFRNEVQSSLRYSKKIESKKDLFSFLVTEASRFNWRNENTPEFYEEILQATRNVQKKPRNSNRR